MKVSFKVAGEVFEYVLTYDFNALCEAEAETGVNLLQAMSDVRSMTAVQLRAMLYAGLKPANPLVLVKEAGELLTKDYAAVMEALIRLFAVAEVEESEKAEAAKE